MLQVSGMWVSGKQVSGMWVSGKQVSGWPLKFCLPQGTRTAQDFQP